MQSFKKIATNYKTNFFFHEQKLDKNNKQVSKHPKTTEYTQLGQTMLLLE